MKKFLSVFFFSALAALHSFSQVGQWVWLHGDSTPNVSQVYGTQGVPSVTNVPPCMYEACQFTDTSGNFWLFGGADTTGWGTRADLWRYNPASNEWTWMKGPGYVPYNGSYGTQGMSSPSNNPPNKDYGITTWTDKQGNLWMFGGRQASNDLWKYDVSTNEWTWMKGSNVSGQAGVYGTRGVPNISNTPGARWECATAWTSTDTAGVNYLWLFGGYYTFNDLWRYNISTNEWTWMKGSSATNQPGVYGTKGVEDSANTPGCRGVYTHWKDVNGNFWLFGGQDNLASARNDLWRYNPVTNNWTWMGGDSIVGATGVYGTQCVLAPANIPGARFENRACWTDQNGNFWMLGGAVGNSFQNIWNDLWMYCVATNQWMWVSGDTVSVPSGNWGTKGISSPTNKPDGRAGALSWTDGNGHLYLFGGSTSPFMTLHNDVWKFTIDPSCGVCLTGLPTANFTVSDTVGCTESSFCVNFSDHSAGNPTSWHWTFTGATPDSSSLQNPDSICYNAPGTYPVTLIVTNSSGSDTLTISPAVTITNLLSPPTITVHVGDTLISSYGATYQWYLNGSLISGATDSFYIAHQGGTYSVQITSSDCNSISNGVSITGVRELSGDGDIRIYPNPASQSAVISWQSSVTGNIEITMMNVLGEKVYSMTTGRKHQTINCKLFPAGVYFVRVGNGQRVWNGKLIIE
jgi:PKD repeat protein